MRAPNAQRGGTLGLASSSTLPPSPRTHRISYSIFILGTRYTKRVSSMSLRAGIIPCRLPPDLVVDGASCRLGRFYDSTIGVRVRARKSRGGGRTEGGHGIEPSAGYRGMFLALLRGCRLSGMYSVLVRSLASCRD